MPTIKETIDTLKGNEIFFTIIIENSLDGINLLDLKTGKYVFMNQAQVTLTGFTKEEINNITAQEAYERTYPDDRQITINQQKKIAAGEDLSEPVEYRWKVKSGEYRWFSDSRKLVRDEQGQAVALVGISRDITEQKKAEEAIKKAEAHYHNLYNNIEDGFQLIEVIRDEKGEVADFRYLEVNDAYERQTGLKASQVLGKLTSEVIPDFELGWLDVFGEVEKTGKSAKFENFGVKKVDSFRHMRLSLGKTKLVFSLGILLRLKKLRKASKKVKHASVLYKKILLTASQFLNHSSTSRERLLTSLLSIKMPRLPS